jgi:hypothetical protein
MTKSITRKKRNKLIVALFSPLLAVVFIVGWALCWKGLPKANRSQKTINKTPTMQDEVELTMIPQEEQILTN